jgi:hypothetical protein
MKKLAAPLLILFATGCQPTQLHGDFVVPPGGQVGGFREAVTQGDGPNGAHIIFLNFGPTNVKAGQQDASATDTSWIAKMNATMTFNTAPYTGSMTADQAEQGVVTWMQKFYAPVNAQIVSTRPPSGKRYTECVIGGTPSAIGLGGQGAAGVAPLDCGNQQEDNLVYAFSDVLAPNQVGGVTESIKEVAVTCAQEVAHAFGLGHTTNMNDVMYPQLTGTTTGFGGLSNIQNDGSGQCGNGMNQNSLQMLIDVMGASNGMTQTGPSPNVAFVTPKDGDTVPLSFDIIVTASETGGTISKVEISSGGSVIDTLMAPPYKTSVTAPQAGTYQLTATAYDATGNFNATSVNITASSSTTTQNECSQPSDCGPGLTCMSNQCVPSGSGTCSTPCPTGQTCQPDGTCAAGGTGGGADGGVGGGGGGPGGVGAMCKDGSQCASGLCAADGDNHFCTQSCDPSKSNSCPNGSACVAAGSDHICEPNNLNGGGVGCGSVVGARHDSGMFGLCLAFALLGIFQLARRRRA